MSVPRQASGEKGPGSVCDAKQVRRFLVAAASDDRENQDADYVHSNRWKDLHEPHITLRPWLPQAIVTSRAPASSEPAARLNARVMGIETEYGISALAPGTPALTGGFGNAFVEDELHPMQLSNHVVKAYGALAAGQPAGWDYETETPLRDIRGYEISRAAAHPDQLTDTDLGMANVILTNGARLYVDHAHPEYSSPEVTCALDAVRYDKAGEAVMALAAQRATQSLGRSVRLYKNNTDGKGASYGTHENYLLQRSTPFDRIVTQFTAFLVSRQVIIGAGRVGRRAIQPDVRVSRSANARISSRLRSDWRPPSTGRSSTPATSRTRMRASIADCM